MRARMLWLGVCFLLCACGSGKSDSGSDAGMGSGSAGSSDAFDAGHEPQRNAVTPGALCERLSTVQCAGEAHCCDAPGRSYDQCKKDMLAGCESTLHLDDIAKNAMAGFDPVQAEAAFAGFEKLAQTCDPSIAAWGSSVDGLRGMLQGTVANGGNCAPRGAATNAILAGTALASCKQPETYACMPRGTHLSGRLDWTCDGKSAKGGACFSDYNCDTGLYCENPKQLLGAHCYTRRADGSSCSFPSQCTSLFCKDGKCVPADQQVAYCLKN